MLGMLGTVIGRIRDVWAGMSLNQRVISGAAVASLFGVALFLTTLTDSLVDYTVLFGELDSQSASEIITHLEQDNVPYKLSRNGTVVEVPSQMVDRLRIQMVADGLPSSGVVGYEILDDTNFGMSDFREKKMYQRALRGELIKTLRAFDEIDDAVVHLNFPEPTLFSDEIQKSTASVTLKLKRGRSLPNKSVQTITNIIGSATGIDPLDVSVADMGSGELLTKPVTDEMTLMSSTQMDLKIKTDQYLASQVKTLLDGAFGRGIALVSVNSELNFDRIEQTSTSYDQDTSGILSEERGEVTNPTGDGGGEETSVTNFELGKTIRNLISSPGSIERKTVSVLIDAKDSLVVDENGDNEIIKVPWSDTDIANLRTICENAVGFDPDTDRLEITHVSFSGRDVEAAAGGLIGGTVLAEAIPALVTGVAIIFAVAMFYVMIRQIARSLDPSKITLEIDAALEKERREIHDETEEMVESDKTKILRKIVSKATQDPEAAAKAIRSIYRSDR
ncbi:flagellar basal-body MS-ring/collar protein FliF [Candidatus Latescibacterota bacterium]